ncbi:hypothetical protein PRUPE_6G011400 [Prunus persica]|uniref:Uncharacterized protein n=1 Tax=Prunus persica TaxID=3760 RepID=A0A251NIE2_PRUPE|nr:hypothetical protein PRUPE_6G011400 [Prunus persica]
MHEAAMAAVEEKLTSLASWGSSPCIIKETHFKQALAKITPSLSDKDLRDYGNFRKQQGKWTSKRKARKGEHVCQECPYRFFIYFYLTSFILRYLFF